MQITDAWWDKLAKELDVVLSNIKFGKDLSSEADKIFNAEDLNTREFGKSKKLLWTSGHELTTPIPGTPFLIVDAPRNNQSLDNFFKTLFDEELNVGMVCAVVGGFYSSENQKRDDLEAYDYITEKTMALESIPFSIEKTTFKDHEDVLKIYDDGNVMINSYVSGKVTYKQQINSTAYLEKEVDVNIIPITDGQPIEISDDEIMTTDRFQEDICKKARSKVTMVHCKASLNRSLTLVFEILLFHNRKEIFVADANQTANNIVNLLKYLRIFIPQAIKKKEQVISAIESVISLLEDIDLSEEQTSDENLTLPPVLLANYKLADLFDPQKTQSVFEKAFAGRDKLFAKNNATEEELSSSSDETQNDSITSSLRSSNEELPSEDLTISNDGSTTTIDSTTDTTTTPLLSRQSSQEELPSNPPSIDRNTFNYLLSSDKLPHSNTSQRHSVEILLSSGNEENHKEYSNNRLLKKAAKIFFFLNKTRSQTPPPHAATHPHKKR